MRAHIDALLFAGLVDADDPDLVQRAWKVDRFGGALEAYAKLELLTAAEVERWRQLIDGMRWPVLTPARLTLAEHEQVHRHLEALLDDVRAATALQDDAHRAQAVVRAAAAADALADVGALSGQQASDWRKRIDELAPPPELPSIPSGSLQRAAATNSRADAAAMLQTLAPLPAGKQIIRVITGTPERHGGLAILALVIHDDCTAVHFHYLGPEAGRAAWDPWESMDQNAEILSRLDPPSLIDASGREYTALSPSPSATGTGGIPDPKRRLAFTGRWTYPPVDQPSGTFTVQAAEHTWRLLSAEQPT